ncbi:MAG: hypothetical protein QME89_08360, partial [Actinomycetota bacterium]|nr:hypothetical protein [Actinomycetota bacterium]
MVILIWIKGAALERERKSCSVLAITDLLSSAWPPRGGGAFAPLLKEDPDDGQSAGLERGAGKEEGRMSLLKSEKVKK